MCDVCVCVCEFMCVHVCNIRPEAVFEYSVQSRARHVHPVHIYIYIYTKPPSMPKYYYSMSSGGHYIIIRVIAIITAIDKTRPEKLSYARFPLELDRVLII